MNIEHFLKETVVGIIVLGALGGGLLLLTLNVYGRANRGIKKLRVLFKDGRNEILKSLLEDEHYFNYYKFKCYIQSIEVSMITIIACISLFSGGVSVNWIPAVIIGISLVMLWVITMFQRKLLVKAYYAKMVLAKNPDLLDAEREENVPDEDINP